MSQVDLKTELLIEAVLKDVFANSTVIKVAHRIEAIMDFDKVIVIDQGEVKEVGKPEELKKKFDSIFYQLFRSDNSI